MEGSNFTSKFAGVLANLKPVSTGVKPTNVTTPLITANPIPNKFFMNRLAGQKMGLVVGSRIKIFDNPQAEGFDGRFFVSKTVEEDPGAAKIGKANSSINAEENIDFSFSYAGIWSIMVQDKFDAIELGQDALVDMNCAVKGKTGGGNDKYRALKEVSYSIEHVGPVKIGEFDYDMWALVERKVVEKSAEDLLRTIEKPAKTVEGEVGQATASESVIDTTIEEEDDIDFQIEDDDDAPADEVDE